VKIHVVRLDKLAVICTIILLFVLEGIYVNNAVAQTIYNTGVLQILLLALSALFSLVFIKTKKVALIVSGLLLSSIMFFSSLLNFENARLEFLALIAKCFLWFFVFLLGYVSTKAFNCENIIPQIAAVACIVFIYIISSNRNLNLQAINANTVVTAVYYLLCCAPFILCMKQKKIRNIMLIIILLFCFFSFKRSALLVTVGALLALFIVNRNISRNFKIYTLGITIIFAGIVFLYIFLQGGNDTLLSALDIWTLRFSGGNESRLNIWRNVIELIEDSPLFYILFGHGYNATMQDTISGLSAHNDFLEIFYNYGFFAFIAFIAFILALSKNSRLIAQTNNSLYNGYICALVIFLMASIPSHMLTYSTYFMLLSFYFGFAIGLADKKKTMQPSGSDVSNN